MCEFAAEEELKEKELEEEQDTCYACEEFCGRKHCPFYKEDLPLSIKAAIVMEVADSFKKENNGN